MTRRGFTMIELLVVVSILAVLLAAVFPAYSAIRRSQRIKRVEATLQTLASGVEAYQNDFGVFPPANPPTTLVADGANLGNRSLVFFLNGGNKLGQPAKGKSAPYLPSRFYNEFGLIRYEVLLDEWDRPYIYFDTPSMNATTTHNYTLLGNQAVQPAWHQNAQGGFDYYYNMGRFQLWSCGPNEKNDGGRNLHTSAADDIANFVVE